MNPGAETDALSKKMDALDKSTEPIATTAVLPEATEAEEEVNLVLVVMAEEAVILVMITEGNRREILRVNSFQMKKAEAAVKVTKRAKVPMVVAENLQENLRQKDQELREEVLIEVLLGARELVAEMVDREEAIPVTNQVVEALTDPKTRDLLVIRVEDQVLKVEEQVLEVEGQALKVEARIAEQLQVQTEVVIILLEKTVADPTTEEVTSRDQVLKIDPTLRTDLAPTDQEPVLIEEAMLKAKQDKVKDKIVDLKITLLENKAKVEVKASLTAEDNQELMKQHKEMVKEPVIRANGNNV